MHTILSGIGKQREELRQNLERLAEMINNHADNTYIVEVEELEDWFDSEFQNQDNVTPEEIQRFWNEFVITD